MHRARALLARFPVVGCGSNVVDRFFRVKALPKPGEKGFFFRFDTRKDNNGMGNDMTRQEDKDKSMNTTAQEMPQGDLD